MNPQRLINKFTRRIFLTYSDLYGFFAQKLFNHYHLYPSKITFKITNICNVDCHFCYNANKNTQAERKSEIDLESWKKLVNNAPFYTAISFTGGEAFYILTFLICFPLSAKKNRKASIVSNGTTLSEEQLNELIDSKLHYLMFSLHGMERNHNRILGGHVNYFEKVTQTIKKLEEIKKKRNSNYPIVGIKVVITNDNYQDVPELMEYVEKELKASHLYFNLLSNEPFELFETTNDAFKNQVPLHLYEQSKIPKIHSLIDHIFNYKKTSQMNIGFTNVFKSKEKLKNYIANPSAFNVTACNKPFHELYIQPNGDIIFCLKYKVTNIKDIDYDIRKIFSLPRYKELLRAFNEKGKKVDYCHTCLEATFEDKVEGLMRKIPRGVYYLSLGRILKTLLSYPFRDLAKIAKVESFEKEAALKLGSPFIQTMPHARISLYYLLKSYKLESGSEVLMSPTTLPDMVNMILLLGLKPVFIDFKDNTHTANIGLAKTLLSKKSKILYLTHLYGILPDMNEARDFAKENNLIFIQDCTQSYGTYFDNKPVSHFADASFYSTCALKDLHTHVGSLLCLKDKAQLEFIQKEIKRDFHTLEKSYFWKFIKEDLVASLALNPFIFSYFTYYIFKILFAIDAKLIEDLIDGRGLKLGLWIFFEGLFGGSGDIRRTSLPKEMLYFFTDLQAEVGLQGLKDIDHFESQRRNNTLLLISLLSDQSKKKLPFLNDSAHHSFWRIPVYVEKQKEFEHYLFDHGIDPGKTTLPCLSEMDIFKDLNQACPIALKMGLHSYFLPNFHYLTEKEIKHVASTINKYFDL